MTHVELAHGAGGRAMAQFLADIIFPHFKLNRFQNGIGLPEADDEWPDWSLPQNHL